MSLIPFCGLLYCRNILESTWNRNAEEEAAFIQYIYIYNIYAT